MFVDYPQNTRFRNHLDFRPIAEFAPSDRLLDRRFRRRRRRRTAARRSSHLLDLFVYRVDDGIGEGEISFDPETRVFLLQQTFEAVRRKGEGFERLAPIGRLERFLERAAGYDLGEQLQGIEKVALARRVRSEEDGQRPQLHLYIAQRLVALNLDAVQHVCLSSSSGLAARNPAPFPPRSLGSRRLRCRAASFLTRVRAFGRWCRISLKFSAGNGSPIASQTLSAGSGKGIQPRPPLRPRGRAADRSGEVPARAREARGARSHPRARRVRPFPRGRPARRGGTP